MKKVYRLKDLDCAVCAAKMEDGIRKIAGVRSVSVNFMAQKMILEADDAAFDSVLAQAVRVCRKVEPDCEIIL